MPDPLVVLDDTRVRVQPGGQATVKVRVTNTDRIVDGFRIDVVGRGPAEWAEVGPAEIRMLPQQDETAVVTFSPPSGTQSPSGTYPFGVRVVSLTDDDNSTVVEGDLKVGHIGGLQAKLTPVNSSGRWHGKHTIRITNSGNDAVRLKLSGSNMDEALGFLIRPRIIDVGLDESAVARVRVRTRHPVLRGPSSPVRIPFSIAAETEGKDDTDGPITAHSTLERPTVEGAFNQRPILPRFLLPLLIFALIAAAAGLAYMVRRDPLEPPAKLGDESVPAVRGLTAEPVDASTIQLTWYNIAGVEGYHIQRYAANGKAPEDSYEAGGLERAKPITDLPPGTKKCFSIVALRRGQPGPESPQKCAKTLPSTATASPQPTGSTAGPSTAGPPVTDGPPPDSGPTTPTGNPTTKSPSIKDPLVDHFLAVGGTFSQELTPQTTVDQWVTDLTAEGLKSVKVLRSEDLVLEPPLTTTPSWVIGAGPYDSELEAQKDACPQLKKVLQTVCSVRLVKAA